MVDIVAFRDSSEYKIKSSIAIEDDPEIDLIFKILLAGIRLNKWLFRHQISPLFFPMQGTFLPILIVKK